jgi:DNA-binding SARP family transcriptional activator/tetratricopeptide (TPR) repeat protein
MKSERIPAVIDQQLLLPTDEEQPLTSIGVGSPAWFAWLDNAIHSSFSYRTDLGSITIRRERKRNGWYWYAYRAINNKLHKIYLGKSDELTAERLRDVATTLTGQAKLPNLSQQIELSFLGIPRLLIDKKPISLTSMKAIVLLAYLCVQDRPQRREHLLAMLWPESEDAQARKNLRNILWILRTILGINALIGTDTLAVHERIRVDIRVFEQLQREATHLEAEGRSSFNTYQAMTDLYQGNFLDGVVMSDVAELETWVTMMREHFHEMHLRALRALATMYRAEGRWPDVVTIARTAVTQDALQEPMYRALMEAHAQMGDRATALRQYDSLRDKLDRELGVSPLPETNRLREEILMGQLDPVLPQKPSYIQPTFGIHESTPFIGHKQEITALDKIWMIAQGGQARVALISGEVGVGKSSIWQMWSTHLDPGVTVLTTSCLPTTQRLPFAPLVDLLGKPALRHRLTYLAQQSQPAWLEDILQLVPDLQIDFPSRTQPPALPAIEEQRRIFEALVQGLGITPQRPTVLFIDDLHWIDQATIEWLGYILHRCHDQQFMFVGAYRSEEAPPMLVSLIAYWGREGLAQRIPLTRLNREESIQLISALHGNVQYADSLYEQSAGNPYFLIELLRAGPGTVPTALTDLIALRLTRLPGMARQVLQAAAVLQPEIDSVLLQQTSGRTDEEMLDAIDVLLQTGLLHEHGDRYEFGHPLIAYVVETEMSRARKTLLHRRAAEKLEQLFAGRLPEISGRLTRHYIEANDIERAAYYAELAGNRALMLAAPFEATNFLEQSLALAPTPARYYRLGLARRRCADLEGARLAFTNALHTCEKTDEHSSAARICLELARICLANNQFDEIVPWIQRAQASLPYDDDPVPAKALAAYLLGGHLRGTGQSLSDAVNHLSEALMIAIKGNLNELLPGVLLEFGNVIAQQGDLTGAIRCFNELIALAHTIGDYFHEALGYDNLAARAIQVGDMTMAQHAIDDGFALAKAHSIQLVYQWLYDTRGKIAMANQQWSEAETWFMRGLVEAERFNNVSQIAAINAALSLIERARGKLDNAVGLLEMARSKGASVSPLYSQIEIDLQLTDLYYERGEVATALIALNRARERLEKSDFTQLRAWSEKLCWQLASVR